MLADFEAMGVAVPPGEETVEDEIDVWDTAWPSFMAFLDCATQWRFAVGFGVVARLGLDWQAADLLLRRRGLPDDAFEDVIAMEEAALEIFAKGDAR